MDMMPKILISGSYNVFEEGWNGCGVYAISGNYKSNTFSTPWYIGSAKNLKRRLIEGHKNSLNKDLHAHNEPLQFSWNKYGENSFIFWLLESCEPLERKDLEQEYLDTYRPFVDEFGGFNICHSANGAFDRSPESIQKVVDFHSKEYKFLSPWGEIFEGKNVSEFCRQNGLVACQMIDVLNSRSLSHKGWTVVSGKKKINKYIGVNYVKINNNFRARILLGEKRVQRNFKNEIEAAEAYDKVSLYIYGIESGPINFPEKRAEYLKTYQEFGKWFCEGKRRGALDRNSIGKGFKLKSPFGQIHEGKNTEVFCEEFKLDPSSIRKVMNGKLKHYKGWTKAE